MCYDLVYFGVRNRPLSISLFTETLNFTGTGHRTTSKDCEGTSNFSHSPWKFVKDRESVIDNNESMTVTVLLCSQKIFDARWCACQSVFTGLPCREGKHPNVICCIWQGTLGLWQNGLPMTRTLGLWQDGDLMAPFTVGCTAIFLCQSWMQTFPSGDSSKPQILVRI